MIDNLVSLVNVIIFLLFTKLLDFTKTPLQAGRSQRTRAREGGTDGKNPSGREEISNKISPGPQ